MNEVIKTILSRRSIRKYTQEQLKKEDLDLILQCGIHAPSARNTQNWHFAVIQNQALIQEMDDAAKEALPQEIKDAHGEGFKDYHIFFQAPTIMIISGETADEKYREMNASYAVENMCLAADSLGIGTCIVGFVKPLFAAPAWAAFASRLEIPETHTPMIAVTFGYKDFVPENNIERKMDRIHMVQ